MKKPKYSFLNLFTINVGTMVGIGIFFKNQGVFAATNNMYIALATWVLGLVLIYGLTLAFAEASSVTTRKGMSGTLANWATLFVHKKAGYAVNNLYSWIWYPFIGVLLAYYAAYFSYSALGWNYSTTNPVFFLAFTLLFWLCINLGNALSIKFGKTLQGVGTFIKFVPFFTVLLLAWFRPTVPLDQNAFAGVVLGKKATWNWAGLFAALPGVFFAFDAFLGGLALSKEESKRGDAYKASLLAVLATGIFYVLFSAAVGWSTNNADVLGWFSNAFGNNVSKLLFTIMVLSVCTTTNGIVIAGARQLKATYDEKAFLPVKSLSKLENDGRHYGQTLTLFVMGSFYAAVMFFAAIAKHPGVLAAKLAQNPQATYTVMDEILNLMDNYGNAVVVFGFWFYMLVVLGVLTNRFTKRHKVEKQKWPLFWAISAFIVGWVVVWDIVTKLSSAGVLKGLVIFAIFSIYFTTAVSGMYAKRKKIF